MGFIKKIIAITGTRADYGIYTTVFEKLDKEFDFSIIATGMHLDRKRGFTINEIKKDGYRICGQIKILSSENDHKSMADAIGKAILGITKVLSKEKPDLLMVLGDRGEMLAGVISAIHLNIPVAHLHGGESSGSVDDNLRHAITKLSHIHFVSNAESRKRVKQLGEVPKNVFNVGAPSLDTILKKAQSQDKEINEKYGIENGKYIILLFHPTTTDEDSPTNQINTILKVLSEFKIQTIAIKSNTDAGGDLINKELLKTANKNDYLKVYDSIPYFEYLCLLKHCLFLIGNSSSGIIEAPSFKIPVINAGRRQRGRLRAKNIIDVGFNYESILTAIKKVVNKGSFEKKLKVTKNPYGDGNASDRIIKVIKTYKRKTELINKIFSDIK